MKQRQVFSNELKLEAVRLLESSDRPVAQVARQLGIRRNQLYRWQQELRRRGNGVFAGPGRPATHDDELAQLRLELERVKEERDILKSRGVLCARVQVRISVHLHKRTPS